MLHKPQFLMQSVIVAGDKYGRPKAAAQISAAAVMIMLLFRNPVGRVKTVFNARINVAI